MPKRIRTPSPPDDESKFLTVVHPYPGGTHMELLTDRKEFAFWLACVIGKENVLAFYYRPQSPSMLIVEILRDFEDWNKILGRHRWSEFLKNPDELQSPRETKVFYCTYNSGRGVQKAGWKRVDVPEDWFATNQFRAENNAYIKYPYPPTSHCYVPREDLTNAPLCRPLPVASFPPPPTARPTPVGAPGWESTRHNIPKPGAKTAWAKGEPSSQAGSSKGRPGPSSTKSSSGSSSTASPPGLPPGILTLSAPPGISERSLSTGGASSSKFGTTEDEDVTSPVNMEPIPEDFETAMESLSVRENYFEGDADEQASNDRWLPSSPNNNAEGWDSGWGVPEIDANTGNNENTSNWDDIPEEPEGSVNPPSEGNDNEWTSTAKSSLKYVKPKVEEKEEEIVCPSHGNICSRGICKDYAAEKRKRERLKKDAERAQERAEKELRRKEKKEAKKAAGGAEEKYVLKETTRSPSVASYKTARNVPLPGFLAGGDAPRRPLPPHLAGPGPVDRGRPSAPSANSWGQSSGAAWKPSSDAHRSDNGSSNGWGGAGPQRAGNNPKVSAPPSVTGTTNGSEAAWRPSAKAQHPSGALDNGWGGAGPHRSGNVPKASGPASVSGTSDGWGQSSEAAWKPSQHNDRASENGWGAAGPQRSANAPKAPESVASWSKAGWGTAGPDTRKNPPASITGSEISDGWGPAPAKAAKGGFKPAVQTSNRGWDNVSNGSWGPTPGNARKGPGSVAGSEASVASWSKVANGAWGTAGPDARKKAPASVVESEISDAWGPVKVTQKKGKGKGKGPQSVAESSNGGWGNVSNDQAKKGPSSVAQSSDGAWGKAPSSSGGGQSVYDSSEGDGDTIIDGSVRDFPNLWKPSTQSWADEVEEEEAAF